MFDLSSQRPILTRISWCTLAGARLSQLPLFVPSKIRDRCVGLKADGSRCNFKRVAGNPLALCRRCAAKQKKQDDITQQFKAAEAESEKAANSPGRESNDATAASPVRAPSEKTPEKRKKSKQPQGLNSMLKSLAKPPAKAGAAAATAAPTVAAAPSRSTDVNSAGSGGSLSTTKSSAPPPPSSWAGGNGAAKTLQHHPQAHMAAVPSPPRLQACLQNHQK